MSIDSGSMTRRRNFYLAFTVPLLLASSMEQSFVRLRLGETGRLGAPIPGYAESLPSELTDMVHRMRRKAAVGSPDSVRQQLEAFQARTQADELIISGSIFDIGARCRSLNLTMEALKDPVGIPA